LLVRTKRVSETVIAFEGEALRHATVTVVTETPSGSWALGGQALTTEDVKTLQAAGAAA
jgi:4-oxalocrotonate tautomerase